MAYTTYQGERVSKDHATLLLAYERAAGVAAQINEGARTIAEQWRFWRIYQAGGNLAAFPQPGAPHIKFGQKHHALDINQGSGPGQAGHVAAFYRRHGVAVAFNVPGEAWHMDVTDKASLTRAAAKIRAEQAVLKRGSRGKKVQTLTWRLFVIRDEKGNRYLPKRWKKGKVFGPSVEAAVKRYQRDHKLKADGIVGKRTREKIKASYEYRRRHPWPKPKPPAPKPTPRPTEVTPSLGIDVSSNNGVIDWDKVAADGVKFAYIKVSEGTYLNPQAKRDAAAAKKAGLLVGAYCFVTPKPGRTGAEEADYFLRHAREAGLLEKGCLRPAADIEVVGTLDAAGAAKYHRDFVARLIEKTPAKSYAIADRRPMIYTGSWFWDGVLRETRAQGCPLWLAAYTPDFQKHKPQGFKSVTIHQYTDQGRPAGTTTHTDMNRYLGGSKAVMAKRHTLLRSI